MKKILKTDQDIRDFVRGCTFMGTGGGAIGPVAAGFIFDAYDNYLPVFYVSVPLMLVTALVALRIKKQESVVRSQESEVRR